MKIYDNHNYFEHVNDANGSRMNFIELLTYVRGALGVVLETRWAADMDGAADDQVASVTAHVTDPLL